jgi:hypothetical protein
VATSLAAVDPSLAEAIRALVSVAEQAGVRVQITSTLRSSWDQRRLYWRWRAGLSGLPAAIPGQSAHEYGWAVDLVTSPEVSAELGSVWRSWGGAWGGSRDPVHFELAGAGAEARRRGAGQYTTAGRMLRGGIGSAADFLLAEIPGVGALELVSGLLSLGYPENQVLKFLSGPGSYLLEKL